MYIILLYFLLKCVPYREKNCIQIDCKISIDISLFLSLKPIFCEKMKFIALSTLVSLALSGALAADVQYSVIAFPSGNQGVSVSVGGQTVALQKSNVHPNIFSGTAPSGETYQYVITDGQTNTPEIATRKLAQGATSTGNEFFNRTQTVWDVPSLPQAYNPIYPSKSITGSCA